MIKLKRVCVPLGLNCNLKCKYCYRDLEKLSKVPDFSKDMIQYLNNIDPSWCEAVVASGGEPLLYWDKVKELFSYVPKNVHKRILTNGTLITKDFVNYVNNNNIEVQLSHDGSITKFLRGIDIFDNIELLNIIKNIETIFIRAVCTKYNCDIWDNFFNTISRLNRTDIYYGPMAIGSNEILEQNFLIEGFDYELYARTSIELRHSKYFRINPYMFSRTLKNKKQGKNFGFNVLPDGTICGMTHICSKYGTIHNTYEELKNNFIKTGQMNKCISCEYNNKCKDTLQFSSEHTCKVRKTIIDFLNNPKKFNNAVYNAQNNISEIEAKYGYTRK